jgi:hypothetical protein
VKAVVVYESLWGNTASVARAIADGLGTEAKVLSTSQATAEELVGADLVVSTVLGAHAARHPGQPGIGGAGTGPVRSAASFLVGGTPVRDGQMCRV